MDRTSLPGPAEVSRYLGVPEGTLAKWRSQGSGPPFCKVGKHIRYHWVDVDKWLARTRKGR
jgi:excisionase family DNA binding protein